MEWEVLGGFFVGEVGVRRVCGGFSAFALSFLRAIGLLLACIRGQFRESDILLGRCLFLGKVLKLRFLCSVPFDTSRS